MGKIDIEIGERIKQTLHVWLHCPLLNELQCVLGCSSMENIENRKKSMSNLHSEISHR